MISYVSGFFSMPSWWIPAAEGACSAGGDDLVTLPGHGDDSQGTASTGARREPSAPGVAWRQTDLMAAGDSQSYGGG
jgi:hypothetical protein